MGSQFVDINADGHLDYLTATFDGSPHVSYGSEKGFGEPVRLKDAQGKRILISSIWNYESRKHENLGHAMPDGKAVRERCISALAFDWDADGDFDLLLGSYENGHLYRQMKVIGAAFSSLGQEAISVGSAYALAPDDVIGPMIRNSGAILVRGIAPNRFLAQYLARKDGVTRGKDGNTHMGDLEHGIIAPISMLSALIPVLAGAALSFKLRGERRVALTWIGDGGSSLGDFHEGLNMAAVLKVPFVLVLENNQYAYSTPVDQQCAVTDFVKKAKGYGVPWALVDGNDVLEVYQATRQAVERARAGEGPTLIEAKTMRMKGHAEHDDFRYVPRELIEEWERKDPIARYEQYLEASQILSPADREAIQRRIAREIEEAQAWAEASPLPDPEDAAAGVYAP